MPANSSTDSGIRLAELMAALSLATDLGMGQPMEFALSACVLAVRLAEKCGYSEEALREVYYQALLRYIGCNAETDWLSSIVGDEQQLRVDFAQIDQAYAPDYVQHEPAPETVNSSAALKQYVGSFLTAFPDLNLSIEDLLADGDKVLQRWCGLAIFNCGEYPDSWGSVTDPAG